MKKRRTHIKHDGTVAIEEEFTLPQWMAAAWTLERKNPEEWGPRRRAEGDLSHLSDDELLARVAAPPDSVVNAPPKPLP